jgi:putative oxidoreductase
MMTNATLLLGRILMSLIFILAGFMKLTTAAATQDMFAKMGLPMPMVAWLVSVVVELIGGLAILLGLWTKPVAIIMGLWCIVTALIAHTNFADQNMMIHFMKNLAMAGGFAYIAVFGAGAWSIDSRLGRPKV